MTAAYAELQVTSNFSFLRGASHPRELVATAAALGHRAIAVVDRNSLAGVVRAHQAARETGIRLVVGCRLDLADGTSLLAYPEDRAAYGRLTRLLTLGKRQAPKGGCRLDYADLVAAGAGLIVAALPPAGFDVVSLAAHRDFALRVAGDFPGRTYLAAHHLYRGDDAKRLAQLAEIAGAARVPLLATNDVLYHAPERRPLQDVLTCIREHCTVAEAGFRLHAHAERHLKTPHEMARLFRGHEAALAAGLEIAERCRFSLDELRYEYPEEPVPDGMTPQQRLAQLTWAGAAERFGGITGDASFETAAAQPPQDEEKSADGIDSGPHPEERPQGASRRTPSQDEAVFGNGPRIAPHPEERPQGASRRTHRDRSPIPAKVRELIEHELRLIEQLGFARYFLTVHDIVSFARSRGILCQGRGSAANSAVCYCLGITAVDPARIDVLFERFISAARGEPPDIDVDFEHERREEVIQYIYEKYGRDRAGLAATVICYRSRSAIREVGKALGLSGDVVAALAGGIWGWSNEPIPDRRVREAGLDPGDRTLRRALDLAGQLTGFPRHLSQHVGGFVITRGPLSELVPIENAAMADRTVIEWDKDDLDALGILKIDILALGMLTCIRKAFALIDRHYGRRLELATVPAEEKPVYDMLSRADSLGVFQVESRAQMTMLPRLKPRKFYDLVIEVAIVRPGPIQGDMVHPYLRRRSGREPVDYPSEALRQVLGKTMGVPLFQEQAMKIAIVGAGFAPAEADRLRRAMATFKRNGDIHLFREKFVAGMVANGYAADFAARCFSQIEGFGTYGFPESHAASFALLVYVSAWIKCFYPDVFACALLNSQPMGFYAPAQIVRDAREHGVEVLPVDVNFSQWDCTLEPAADCIGGGASFETAAPQPPQDEEKRAQDEEKRARNGGKRARNGGKRAQDGEKRGIDRPHPEERSKSASRRTRGARALRLGFRQIKGFVEDDAGTLVAARGAGYRSVHELWRKSGLGRAALERLADADALHSLGLDRRRALWALKALGETPLPLFATAPASQPPIAAAMGPSLSPQAGRGDNDTLSPRSYGGRAGVRGRHEPADPETRAAALLPEMTLGEHVVEDYAHTSLSLKRHPLAFLRRELAAEGMVTAADLATLPVERRLAIAGVVLIRQRPGSANGVVFVTIEDETGIANLILWPPILERFRRAALGATLLYCRGRLQREESVIHVVAEELRDLTSRLDTLRCRNGDEVEVLTPQLKPPFSPPQKPPGYDSHDIVVPSRNFR